MPSVCFYFQVHQPYRIKKYNFLDIGKDSNYFDSEEISDLNNRLIMEKVAKKSYIPTNKMLFKLLKKHPQFRFTFSFSGTVLEQMEKYSKEALKSFQDLVSTGRVEVLGETYYHSLSFLYSKKEFQKQVKMNLEKVEDLFSVKPKVFRCTELAYSNEIAKQAEEMGFEGILGEGVDHILGWRSPNFLYKPKNSNIKLFLKNYRLSDDIAFRFSERTWKEFPLTAEKYSKWVSEINGNGEIVNLFMDYETFGEHQWEDTGIFKFLEKLPEEVLKNKDNDFSTLSESINRYPARDEIDVPNITFAYKDGESVFNNFNLKIEKGKKVALVGRSGAGKTTVVKLILRFLDLDSGKIKIDGQDIASVTQDDLRKNIAYVPQEPSLFHRTVKENIGYGEDDVSFSEVVEAAKRAQAHDFIVGLPNGYDSLVGERGIKLSGGERQRIAIARAMLKKSKIVILDEATSSLDTLAEEKIQKALLNLTKETTTIIIAHRLSTIKKVDQIIVFEKGEVVETGTHRELLEKKGFYESLWKSQVGGFIK
jgi:alpha-amylase